MFNKWLWEMSAIETPWGVDRVPQNKEEQLSLSRVVCLFLHVCPPNPVLPLPQPSPHLRSGHTALIVLG